MSVLSTCGSPSENEFSDLNETKEFEGVTVGSSDTGEVLDYGTAEDRLYDAWSRQVKVTVSSTVVSKFQYNGLGQKVKRTDSATLDDTHYYYSAENQVLEEAKVSGGAKINSYVWGTQNVDDLVQRIGSTTNSEEYYVLDANNNVVLRLDYNANAIARYVYDAYGNPKQLDPDYDTYETIDEDYYLFTGRPFHMDSGQYDYRARWLDPQLGVFSTRDPIGPWGDPLAFGNAYMYAGGDPVSRRDPSGENIVPIVQILAEGALALEHLFTALAASENNRNRECRKCCTTGGMGKLGGRRPRPQGHQRTWFIDKRGARLGTKVCRWDRRKCTASVFMRSIDGRFTTTIDCTCCGFGAIGGIGQGGVWKKFEEFIVSRDEDGKIVDATRHVEYGIKGKEGEKKDEK